MANPSALPTALRVVALSAAVGVGAWLVVKSQRDANPPAARPASPAAVPPATPTLSTPAPPPTGGAPVTVPSIERTAPEGESAAARRDQLDAPPEPVAINPTLFHSSKAFVPPPAALEPPDVVEPPPMPHVYLPTSKAADPALWAEPQAPQAPP